MQDIHTQFKPMLGASPPDDYSWDLHPWKGENYLASYKIDGVRATVHPLLGVVSRTLKPIPNKYIQETLFRRELFYLDGELTVGASNAPDVFGRSMSGVMSRDGTPNFVFNVFDHWGSALTCGFGIRNEDAKEHVRAACEIATVPGESNSPQIVRVNVLDQWELNSYEEFERLEQSAIDLGYEGLMVRDKRSHYKFGRATWKEQGLIKVKRYRDDEGVIVDWEPLYRNQNEAFLDETGHQKRSTHQANMIADHTRVGKLVLRVTTGPFMNETVSVGSGLTDEQRVGFRLDISKMIIDNQVVSFKWLPHGSKDAPRHPIFKGLRDD